MNIEDAIERLKQVITNGVFTNQEGTVLHSEQTVKAILKEIQRVKSQQKTVFVIGNGGSAAIASHLITDLRNVGELCAMTLHESGPMTCFANDYGYEQAFSRQINLFAKPQDLLIAISSSGKSPNIVNAVEAANKKDLVTFTLSGFKQTNPLRKLGQWNYHLDIEDYGLVEVGHQFLLHYITDILHREKSCQSKK